MGFAINLVKKLILLINYCCPGIIVVLVFLFIALQTIALTKVTLAIKFLKKKHSESFRAQEIF